ncbi:response regulator [Azospirillum rugosum]|uniref:histidine kinase n=1 Tax=Azospirillum rugosum TaxID=416170 RepID=A0ABS4SHB2_9PROT|nr:response regulator [Azospirillum rugosum]MBP2291897.1 signal transduction histidine kinase/DNA-binding response OmpR family regulator [Azospirillum rugosum]MDQ0530899.1 signal transduction histidine kinase/DNA-binding response OmpR family regulator [Azospirillum rugosum]
MDVQARWLDRLITLRLAPAAAHGIALGLVALAAGARLALEPFVTGIVPFVTLFPAVLVAALVGGGAAGLTAWAASALLAWTYLLPATVMSTPPVDGPAPGAPDAANLALFSLSCLLMVLVAHRLRVAFARLRDDEEALRARAEADAAERRRTTVELERLVGEGTRALEDSNRRLLAEIGERERAEGALARMQRLEAVGQLTGGVAHDFNNLLTVIVGNLDMIARTEGAPDRVRNLSAAALAAAERGERLTRQLLAFARRQPLRPEVVDIDRLVREEESLIRRAVGEAVEVRFSLGAGHDHCRIDATQFEAALLNLVVNARDATPAGGSITIATWGTTWGQSLRDPGAPQSAPADLPPGRYAVVSVRDTGTGIPPDVLPSVFDPFFTTKDVGKGSGLGLSQVYGFVRQSGGQVRVDSAVGRGTAVELWLPCTGPCTGDVGAPAGTNPADAAAGLRGRGETILVVEDDADVRAMAVETLEGLGYQVLVAGDGLAALAMLAAAARVDLLFTDVVMPKGLGGVGLAHAARGLVPGLRVLLTSGYPARPPDADPPESLPYPLLPKPYRSDALARAIRAALAPAPAAGRTALRVLVVEDDLLVRMSTVQMLDEIGAEVVGEAGSAEEALTMLDRLDAVDVLLTDLRLPGRDGLSLAQEARRRTGLLVVLATGCEDEALRMDDVGVVLLPKPYGPLELSDALERARHEPVE